MDGGRPIVTEHPSTDKTTVGNSEDPPPATGKPAAKKDRHLYQIDLVRLVTFGGVILDHVMLSVTASTNVAAGAVEVFLRYTRYGFFALTGFVLTYQYRKRDLSAGKFWRRRFKLIGLPFLMWSLFYWFFIRYRSRGADGIANAWNSVDAAVDSVKSIVYDLITGHAAYHLYFLSVSMQIYLVFPLVLYVLKRTWGYHRYLLAVSIAFQMWMMYSIVRPPLDFFTWGIQSTLWTHVTITILPYQGFILSGCVAAMHYEAFHTFIKRWRRYLIGLAIVVIVATWLYYLYTIDQGEELFRATNVFMLHNMWAYVAIIVMLYSIGSVWMERRTPGSIIDRLMRTASDRSFGIYLAHVLALYALLPQAATPSIHALPRVLLAYLLTVALTIFLVETLRRSPISLITTGRNRIDWRTQNAGRSALVGLGGVAVGLVMRLGFGMWGGNVVTATGVFLIASMALVYWHQMHDETAAEDAA
ncbi:MAG: acyltransferase [Gordonia sp. (in: high G+C Gram-positive bacteria)]